MVGLLNVPAFMPAYTADGFPISGAKLYTYIDQTNTPVGVFLDAGLTVPAPNPIIANAAGIFPFLYAADGLTFTVGVTNASGALLPGGNLTGVKVTADATTIAAAAAIASANAAAASYTATLSLFNQIASYVSGALANLLYQVPGIGGIVESVYANILRARYAEQYGALSNGVFDDAIAIQRCLNATGSCLIQGNQTYYCKSQIVLPAFGGIVCQNGYGQLLKAANIDMIDMSASRCFLQNVRVSGASATYTSSRGAILSGSGSDQWIVNSEVKDMGGYAVEFLTAEVGQRFRANTSNFQSINAVASVKMADATEFTGGRTFDNCEALGTKLIHFGGSANVRLNGGACTGLIYTATTSRSIVTDVRLATMTTTLTINGDANVFNSNLIAGSLVLAATSSNCTINADRLANGFTITDLSTATGDTMNNITGHLGDTLSTGQVIWSQASGTGPTLGNGAIGARIVRTGLQIKVDLQITMGSTTTFGDGTVPWQFEVGSPIIPPTAIWRTTENSLVSAFESGVQTRVGEVYTLANTRKLQARAPGDWGRVTPHTWKNGDVLRFTGTFELG